MPSTVYKGDLTEVSFGHETALRLDHGYAGSFTFTATTVTAADETSLITLTNGAASTPVNGGILKVPIGMLVGVKVSIVGGGSAGFTPDDGRLFTVIAQTKNTFTVTPALNTAQSTASAAGDALIFHSLAMPSVDVNSGHNDNANASTERSLLDQFVGLTAAVTLPETKVDLKRYHVVGLGRDVAVQVPGRFVNQGGSFEVNMHNPRWLYYCLGMEAVDVGTTYDSLCVNNNYAINVTAGTKAGATTIPFDGTGTPTFSTGSSPVGAGDYVIIKDTGFADIVTYKEADTADGSVFGAVTNPESVYFDRTEKSEIRRIVAITADTIFLDDALLYPHDNDTPIHFARFGSGSAIGSPDRASTGALTNGVTRLLYSRSHVPSFAMEVSIRRRDAEDDTAVDGSSTDTKQLTRVFRGCKVKDFSLTADTDAALRLNVNFDSTLCYTDTGRLEDDAATATLVVTDSGGVLNGETFTLIDSADLTTVYTVNSGVASGSGGGSGGSATVGYSGVGGGSAGKVAAAAAIAAAINATTDANYTAVSNGVDTVTVTQGTVGADGAKTNSDSITGVTVNNFTLAASNKGDRYDAHRMFEDTANSDEERKKSGIAPGTQKPFMFYNGTVTFAGRRIGQVVSFTLNGSTGVQQFYTINGAAVTDDAKDQTPFAGSRNASLSVEGKTEYSMDMEIIVEDPIFYHEMRRAVGRDPTTADMIRLSFTKPGTASGRESLDIMLDDYYITEAGLPIPEDKGPIRAPLKVLPKAIRVVSTDTLFHC